MFFTYLATLLFEIAIVDIAAVISGCVAENELEIGPRRGKRDLRIPFPATILKAHLAFLDWSVSVTSVSDLCRFKEKKKKHFTIFSILYRAIDSIMMINSTEIDPSNRRKRLKS